MLLARAPEPSVGFHTTIVCSCSLFGRSEITDRSFATVLAEGTNTSISKCL